MSAKGHQANALASGTTPGRINPARVQAEVVEAPLGPKQGQSPSLAQPLLAEAEGHLFSSCR